MRVALFSHSLLSDYNHGNAHFLRGIVTELTARRHEVRVYEPRSAWSVENLVNDHGEKALELTRQFYPRLRPRRYDLTTLDLEEALDGIDLVLVHEWNDHELVRRIGNLRRRPGTRFRALFHDTHHRSVTDPESMAAYDLSGYDGVLAFGAAVRDVYVARGWASRVWVWHEAADPRVFFPQPAPPSGKSADVVWIGNWGDEERSEELRRFFLEPVRDLGLKARAHGVRYPEEALRLLAEHGISFAGWLPNFRVPDVYAGYRFTVHIPRRPYATALPGVPTIRVFEALACGMPLVCAPWDDAEGLFRAGHDFLVARDGEDMRRHMSLLSKDAAARSELARNGRRTILFRHTCAHRVDELTAIAGELGVRVRRSAVIEGAVAT